MTSIHIDLMIWMQRCKQQDIKGIDFYKLTNGDHESYVEKKTSPDQDLW